LAFWGYKVHVFVDYPKASEILADYAYANVHQTVGEDDSAVLKPVVVESLSKKNIVEIEGGSHHSIAGQAQSPPHRNGLPRSRP